MTYIQGEGRGQGSLFPVVLDDFVSADHMCRVIDVFVARLALSALGFEHAHSAETGRPGYDPRDLLKLYLYGYLNHEDSYLCFIEPHKPRMWSGFRRVDTREHVAKLQQAMDKVLSDNLSIREKRWWTFEEFNQPEPAAAE
jgi:hypothetical protein